MANQRMKMWLLATVTLLLIGLFGLNSLAGSMTTAQPARSRASAQRARSLFQVHEHGARLRSVVLTVTIGDAEEEADANSSEFDEEEERSDSVSSDNSSSSSSSVDHGSKVDSDEAGRELRVGSISPLRRNASVPRATKRMLNEMTSACDARQPYIANCFKLFGEGQERTIQRLAQAVGHLEIEEDQVACSGVLLDGKSKTAMYFLTAARCLPNEKNVGRARIHFTGCAGTNTYKNPKVYALSRFLGYVILRFDADAAEVRTTYGFLHLRATRRALGEKVFIAHYASNSPVKRLTTTYEQAPIVIKPSESSSVCFDAPHSRVGYSAPLMDSLAVGAPVISLADGAVVALHLCGDCSLNVVNSGLSSYSILVDLDNRALEVGGFSQPAQDEF